MGIREGGGMTGEPSPEDVDLDATGESCRPEVSDKDVGEVIGTGGRSKYILRTSLGLTIVPDLALLLGED